MAEAIVAWNVKTGRVANWLDTGIGKTFIQLEYARLSGDRSLIVAPLAVCHQTVREAAKLGIDARYVRSDANAAGPGIWVTNYEMALQVRPVRTRRGGAGRGVDPQAELTARRGPR